jgi:hypothetical protein
MIGFMDVTHVDEKPATRTSDLYYEVGLAIYLLPCRTAALVTTPASIRGAIPRPGLRKYLNQTIHGPFREAQRFLNLKFQQRDQGRAPRAEIITLSGCQWWPGRDSGRGPSRLRITPAALHLPVLGTRLIGAIGKMDIEGLYAQNVRARPVPGGPAPHPKMRASPPPS